MAVLLPDKFEHWARIGENLHHILVATGHDHRIEQHGWHRLGRNIHLDLISVRALDPSQAQADKAGYRLLSGP